MFCFFRKHVNAFFFSGMPLNRKKTKTRKTFEFLRSVVQRVERARCMTPPRRILRHGGGPWSLDPSTPTVPHEGPRAPRRPASFTFTNKTHDKQMSGTTPPWRAPSLHRAGSGWGGCTVETSCLQERRGKVSGGGTRSVRSLSLSLSLISR